MEEPNWRPRARRQREIVQAEGAPIYVRDCEDLAVIPVADSPSEDLCGALPAVESFSLAVYARSRFAALLARAMERQAGATELGGLTKTYRLERQRTRLAVVRGSIRIADGRSDPAFFGGHTRLVDDVRSWNAGEPAEGPVQLKRLRQMEAAGVDAIEFPTKPAVDMRFARLNLAQPIVISQTRFRTGVFTGRIEVKWL